MLASDSENFRRNAIFAFAGSDDPAVVGKLLALTPRMRIGELRYLFQYLSSEPVGRTVLWNWLKTNYAAILARVSPQGMSRAPGALGAACDAGARAELDAFFAPKVKDLEGAARPLALAEESIDRCIAFKNAKGAEIAAALKAQK
jgi:alanyl aminopeptidase